MTVPATRGGDVEFRDDVGSPAEARRFRRWVEAELLSLLQSEPVVDAVVMVLAEFLAAGRGRAQVAVTCSDRAVRVETFDRSGDGRMPEGYARLILDRCCQQWGMELTERGLRRWSDITVL